MHIPSLGKAAIVTAGLAMATFAGAAPAAAGFYGSHAYYPRVERVQYYGPGPGWRHERRFHPRRHFHQPRCWRERIVRYNRWGHRVVEMRRICR